MIVYLDCNECYPYYDWSDDPDFGHEAVEVPEKQFQKWQRVMNEFFEVQKEMEQYHNAEAKRKANELIRKERGE